MYILAAIAAVVGALFAIGTPAHAGLHAKVATRAAIADNNAHLACFDELAVSTSDTSALTPDTAEALKKEFCFDPGPMSGLFTFRFSISGDLCTGAELLTQAQTSMVRSRLAKDHYSVTQGADTTPVL